MDATGQQPGARANLISPQIRPKDLEEEKCLSFAYNAFGAHSGTLRVLDDDGLIVYESPNSKQIIVKIYKPQS